MCEVGPDQSQDLTCKDVFVMPQRDGWVDYKMDIKFNKYKQGIHNVLLFKLSTEILH